MAIISTTMQDAFNEQIKNEVFSAYIYLSTAAYFESKNMPGSAKWMRAQNAEETTHVMKMFDFVADRGGRVTLQAIPQPPADFASPVDVWKNVWEHEQKVTAAIYKLDDLAVKEGDLASHAFLQWFITEQVEEEKSAQLMYERFQQAGSNAASLLLFDGHFTKRGE